MRQALSALAKLVAVCALTGVLILPGSANAFQLPQVSHAATLKECTACHMIFPPQMLPARSWTALMGNLANHFGENASLDAKVQADITAYLTANAADTPQYSRIRGLLAGVADSEVPLRITDIPWWRRIHGDPANPIFKRPQYKSASNCIACHQGADTGVFQGED